MGIIQILGGLLPFIFINHSTPYQTNSPLIFGNNPYQGIRRGKSTRTSDYIEKKIIRSRKRNKISKQSRKINYA